MTQAVQHKFAFGRNWAQYARHITSAEIDEATAKLKELSGNLAGKTVFDIGCGSGIHSLAALRANAAHVTAADVDEQSLSTARKLLEKHADGGRYTVERFDALSPDVPDKKYDVVYSWGVLHHTGDLWKATEYAMNFVSPGGRLVIAIYKKTPLCGFWKLEKACYSRLPSVLRFPVTLIYAISYLLGITLTGKNPYRYVREYKGFRGMNFWHDCIDWLGGYPYQSATPEEVKHFVVTKGFVCIFEQNTHPARMGGLFGTGCAEYVFVRK